MKKLLIATAALAMVAGTAQAQSSVTVYGNMDMSYGENKVSGDTAAKNVKTTGLADDAVNSSRIGFRGVEDIGGGVKAGFVIESNLDMVKGKTLDKANRTGSGVGDNAGILGATRQTMLTLSDAKLGTVGIGYKKTLETDFNDLYFTGTENSAGNQAHTTGRAVRANGIYYTSPAFSGVTVSAQLVSGESKNESSVAADVQKTYDASMTQFGINYAAGALQIGAVYFNGSLKDNSLTPATEGSSLITDAKDMLDTGDNDYKGYGIGANYNFGFAKVTAQMGERKVGAAATQGKNEYSSLGVTFPVGKLDLMAAYSMQEIKESGVKQNETDGYQLIARYNLSKRTNVYALVGENKKESATAGTADVKTSVARVGVAHSF
jgi:general bacterial porin, GBP family